MVFVRKPRWLTYYSAALEGMGNSIGNVYAFPGVIVGNFPITVTVTFESICFSILTSEADNLLQIKPHPL